MSELIQMRHRMKAVKTIQKITRAMCLVSMSTHTRMRSKRQFLQEYTQELTSLFVRIRAYAPEWQHPAFNPPETKRHLIIIIGPQKGLCGVFSANLSLFFAKEIQHYTNFDLVTIGQNIGTYSKSPGIVLKDFPHFSHKTMPIIARAITQLITTARVPYESVAIISNHAKSFFIQKPQTTVIIPFLLPDATSDQTLEDYIWEQQPSQLLDALAADLLDVLVQDLMFQSLLAEQAARFIAMDGATRNAHNLLTSMRLNYNKLRQAKITRELTDLIGSFF